MAAWLVHLFVDDNTISFEGESIVFLKRFEFDHERMTQSVVVKQAMR